MRFLSRIDSLINCQSPDDFPLLDLKQALASAAIVSAIAAPFVFGDSFVNAVGVTQATVATTPVEQQDEPQILVSYLP